LSRAVVNDLAGKSGLGDENGYLDIDPYTL